VRCKTTLFVVILLALAFMLALAAAHELHLFNHSLRPQ
jgi:hypothetical protein